MKMWSLRWLAVLCVAVAVDSPMQADDGPKIDADLIYGRKDGMALTLDVIRPAKLNGAGILWMFSGGWRSSWIDPKVSQALSKPFLDKGFTMFIVRHGSSPKYNIPEIAEDVRRSVRFVRMKAKSFGVDPERLGAFGLSAGGHLSLLLGTTATDGDSDAKDEVLRHSNRVAAVVAFFPPTDLRDWVSNPTPTTKRFPALHFDPKKAPAYSPLLHVTDKTPPILMIHGDKDTLVPISHSKNMLAALEKAKVDCKLVVVEGAGHGFNQKQNQEIVAPAMVDWFVKHLTKKSD
jgi:acetyl esterase/lipase